MHRSSFFRQFSLKGGDAWRSLFGPWSGSAIWPEIVYIPAREGPSAWTSVSELAKAALL
jgi:hypothetical protein